ncbi:MAG: Nif3-like dinuclear metal center hexameric protein [Chitinophagaceae bacterium]
MIIREITGFLESLFPLSYQESYDNAGLILGDDNKDCTGAIICLDVTEAIVQEAMHAGCNLIIAHHPLIFKGLKKINGNGYVEKSIIVAIKNDIAVYAIHTNMDNVATGVSGRMADRLGLINRSVLRYHTGNLSKVYTFVPEGKDEELRKALFGAGGGMISHYSECSFNVSGFGTFRAGEGTNPYVGNIGEQHREKEVRVEMVFPSYLQAKIISSLREVHPYEEVAFDVVELVNSHPGIGSGLTGDLGKTMTEEEVLHLIKERFDLSIIRHTPLTGKMVKKIALCGGAGSFLIPDALHSGAQFYLSSDIKYHEFFGAEGQLVIADIGHYESEQFTIDLLIDLLRQKFNNFALLKTGINTNPVKYFPG